VCPLGAPAVLGHESTRAEATAGPERQSSCKVSANARTNLRGRSLEAYYQETGRAGRDGLDSEALLYYTEHDISTHRYMIHKGHEDGFISEARVQVCCRAEGCKAHTRVGVPRTLS
jgi:hypothetical protein